MIGKLLSFLEHGLVAKIRGGLKGGVISDAKVLTGLRGKSIWSAQVEIKESYGVIKKLFP